VVKKTKNRDMPSIPKTRFKFKLANQKNLTTNWKDPVDFWNRPHKTIDPMNDKHDEFKAITFNNFFLLEEILSNNKRNLTKSFITYYLFKNCTW
jgi:hypothetical protein